MSDPYAKVTTGDPLRLSATVWNRMIDAAKDAAQQDITSGPLTTTRSATIIRVRNDTGADQVRNSVVGLSGPIFTPLDTSLDAFLRELTFRAVTPDIELHRRRYAVLLDPAPMDRVVRAYLAGVCPVRVDIVDQSHEYAVITNGNTVGLTSSRFGHTRILWCESDESGYYYSTGLQWAIVMLGVTGSCFSIGKAHTDITPRSGSTYGTGTVDLYRSVTTPYGGGYVEDEDGPLENVEVLNACGDVDGGIATGKYVSVAWDANDQAWVAPLECPDPYA